MRPALSPAPRLASICLFYLLWSPGCSPAPAAARPPAAPWGDSASSPAPAGPAPSERALLGLPARASQAPVDGEGDPRDAGPAVIALLSPHSRSARLTNGLYSPLPGGQLSGYRADTGLDVSGFKKPVFAIAAGTIEYAEAGHTRWTGRGDSHFTVRLRLDAPLPWKGRRITHAYYGHLSSLDFVQHEGALPALHVEGGQRFGVSGWARGSPHLHLGLLLDGVVTQESWEFLLDEGEVREVLGGMPNGARLP